MTSWECPNCEHTPANVRDTQLYLPTMVTAGYESDSSWELNPDSNSESEDESLKENESEDDAPVVIRRKPKVNAEYTSGGSLMSFTDVGRRFATALKAAHLPM